MGGFTQDIYVAGMLEVVNLRFAPGDAIDEMIALQKEFDIFCEGRSVRSIFALLNIGPTENWAQRRGWYKFLSSLTGLPSDKRDQTADQRIVSALRTHLASKEPLPVYFTAHASSKNPGVYIKSRGTPLVYSTQEYLIISLPMTAVEKDREKRRAKR